MGTESGWCRHVGFPVHSAGKEEEEQAEGEEEEEEEEEEENCKWDQR